MQGLFIVCMVLSSLFFRVDESAPVGELMGCVVLWRDGDIDVFAVASDGQREGAGGEAMFHIRVEELVFVHIADGTSRKASESVGFGDACLLAGGDGQDFGYGNDVAVFVTEDDAVEIVAVEFHAEFGEAFYRGDDARLDE